MTDFRFETELAVRYRDLDPLGHVNNAVYASYMEQARTRYLERILGTPPADVQAVIAHIEIDFRRSIEGVDDDVVVGVRTTDFGESSITMEYEVRANDAVSATGETVMVAVDREGTPVPVPGDTKAAIREFEGHLAAER
jgi:acyl-CoA thioester hydrolase